MELLTKRPSPPLTSPTPHPRRGKRHNSTNLLRLLNRIPVPIQHRNRLAAPRSPIHRRTTTKPSPKTSPNYIPNSGPNNLPPPNEHLSHPRPQYPNRSPKSHLPRSPPPKHLRLRSPPNTNKNQLGNPQHRKHPPRTLRHDRSRHGDLLRSARLRPGRRERGMAFTRRGGSPS